MKISTLLLHNYRVCIENLRSVALLFIQLTAVTETIRISNSLLLTHFPGLKIINTNFYTFIPNNIGQIFCLLSSVIDFYRNFNEIPRLNNCENFSIVFCEHKPTLQPLEIIYVLKITSKIFTRPKLVTRFRLLQLYLKLEFYVLSIVFISTISIPGLFTKCCNWHKPISSCSVIDVLGLTLVKLLRLQAPTFRNSATSTQPN